MKIFLQHIFLKVAIKCLFTYYKDLCLITRRLAKVSLLLLKDTVSLLYFLVYADSANPSSDLRINGFKMFSKNVS